MKDLLLTLLHLAVMTATLCGPGGVRAVIAENLLLKQQLIVVRRPRQRAPMRQVCWCRRRSVPLFGALHRHSSRSLEGFREPHPGRRLRIDPVGCRRQRPSHRLERCLPHVPWRWSLRQRAPLDPCALLTIVLKWHRRELGGCGRGCPATGRAGGRGRWGMIDRVRTDRAAVDGGRRRVGPAKRAISGSLSAAYPVISRRSPGACPARRQAHRRPTARDPAASAEPATPSPNATHSATGGAAGCDEAHTRGLHLARQTGLRPLLGRCR